MKNKLLIVNKKQFGYHIDTYYYCQYLKNEYDITYVCFDISKKKIHLEGINIMYIQPDGNALRRAFYFLNKCRLEIKKNNYDLIFINYFQTSSFLKLGFDKNKFIIDIRTGAIGRTQKSRNRYDLIMKIEMKVFKYKTIISKCLQKKLNIIDRNTYILPLGADTLSNKIKNFKELKLIYIGTLDSRNIHETIIGVAKFISENENVSISYDIFGSGCEINEDKLQKEINNNKLNEIVTFHGRKEHNELQYYFDNCNLGVSYIPITDYFDCQPPTKTYEYINSGIYCIATKTQENINLISTENGILCMDNAESFYQSLIWVNNNKDKIDTRIISTTLKNYTWANIVNNKLKPVLNMILKGNN